MKILHIMTVPQSLTFLAGQVRYMKSRGMEIRVLSSPGSALQKFSAVEGAPVDEVKMERRISPLRDLVSLVAIWWKLRRIRPHVVHAHTPKGGLLGMIGAWLSRVPVRVYHMRGMPMTSKSGVKRAVLRWAEKISCGLSHQVLCISHSLRDVAVSEGICSPEKIKVLGCGSGQGVDGRDRFNPRRINRLAGSRLRREYDIPADAPVVAFIGRIVRDKGMLELVAAWNRLRERFPSLHLLIAGRFEPQDRVAPEVERVLREDDRIHLAGYVEDTPSFYSAMDVLVFPTYREGFPNVLLEAAAMEVPVVATWIPGCVDAVEDGVTGTLVPVRDAEALAEAVARYLKDPELRRRHGRAGRRRVLRDFRPKVIWEAMYQEYVRLREAKGLPVPEPRGAPPVEKMAA